MEDGIAQQIKSFDAGREKDPLKIKYRAMAENPFRFFRGTCQVFYAALYKNYPFPASPAIWACGDLHIENFGSYKGANQLVYFDMNDFDEALLAPALGEVCRLAASVQLAAAEMGFSKKDRAGLVKTLLAAYQYYLQKGKPVIIEAGTARGIIKKVLTRVADRKEMDLVRKRTDKLRPDKLLLSDRLFALPKPERKDIVASFNKWLADTGHGGLQALDAGFRIAGTGSIGVKRYILLLAYTANPQRKLLIDVKEAREPAPKAYINMQQPVWLNNAARIITVQEMMQQVTPAFLSSFAYNENWFVVKELQPTADKVNLFQTVKAEHMHHYMADLGMLTAAAQLRSSGRLGAVTADELSGFAATGNWTDMLMDWLVAYHEQVKQEYAIFKEAWELGFFNG